MNDNRTPTVGGLLADTWARLQRDAQVALLLIALLVIAQYLLFRDLAGPFARMMEEVGQMQDPQAMRMRMLPLLRPWIIHNLVLSLIWLLAMTVWAHVLTHGRQLAASRMGVTFLQLLWRSIAMVGWGFLLGIPLAAFYLLVMGVLGFTGVKLSMMQMNLFMMGLAVVVYLPLFATYLLAVVETAARGRTPIHQAFDALGHARVPYFLANFGLTAALTALSSLVMTLFGHQMQLPAVSLAISAAFNGIWLMAALALAAAVRPYTRFAQQAAPPGA